MSEKPVFSTSSLTEVSRGKKNSSPKKQGQIHEKNSPPKSSLQTRQPNALKMRLETKGRGGKAVTVLFDFGIADEEIRNLGKQMQEAFGVGGTFKDGSIELRGDLRDRAESYLKQKGYKVVRAGG